MRAVVRLGSLILVSGCVLGKVEAPDPCLGQECSGHGECFVAEVGAACLCDDGFTTQGLSCVSACASVTCSGHGTCSAGGGGPVCSCATGYHAQGLQCLADANPCAGQLCSGHGSCATTGATASCTCEGGYHPDPADPLACVADAICTGGPPCPNIAELTWMAPTTNADGSPLADLGGYRIYWDTTTRGSNTSFLYAHVVDADMPACAAATGGGVECQYDLEMPAGSGVTYYFAVTAHDTVLPANESAYSNEVSKAF
jgi:hypothetical protein